MDNDNVFNRLATPAGVFSFALTLRLAFLFLLPSITMQYAPDLILHPDTLLWYEPIALNLLDGKGFTLQDGSPTAEVVPVFPLFLAGVYLLFGLQNYLAVKVCLCVSGALTCLLVYLTGNKVFNERVGRLAAIITACYPILVWLSSKILIENLFAVAICLFALSFAHAFQVKKISGFFLAGLILGFATLTRPDPLIFPGFAIVGVVFFHGFTKKTFLLFGSFLLGFSLILSPWLIRHYIVFDKFIFVAAGGGQAFFQGSSLDFFRPDDQEVMVESMGKLGFALKDGAPVIAGGKKFEYLHLYKLSNEDSFTEAAIKNYKTLLLENPLGLLKLVSYKSLRFWYARTNNQGHMKTIFLQGCLLIPAIAGLVFLFKNKEYLHKSIPLLLIIFYTMALHVSMYPILRNSLPIMPLVSLFSAYGLIKVFSRE